jgi:hypothetical protein
MVAGDVAMRLPGCHRRGVVADATHRLVEIFILTDGAEMRCSYCGAAEAMPLSGYVAAIAGFQDHHFGCDPALTPMPRQRNPLVAR